MEKGGTSSTIYQKYHKYILLTIIGLFNPQSFMYNPEYVNTFNEPFPICNSLTLLSSIPARLRDSSLFSDILFIIIIIQTLLSV